MIYKASINSDASLILKVETIKYSDDHLAAEIYWLSKMANWNYSLHLVGNVSDIFHKMIRTVKL